MPLVIPTAKPATPPANAAPGSLWVANGLIVIYNGANWVPLGNVPEEEQMAEFRVSHKTFNVNTKRLVQRVVGAVQEVTKEFIFQRSSTLSKTYDFSQLVEYLDLYMHELQDDNVEHCDFFVVL